MYFFKKTNNLFHFLVTQEYQSDILFWVVAKSKLESPFSGEKLKWV